MGIARERGKVFGGDEPDGCFSKMLKDLVIFGSNLSLFLHLSFLAKFTFVTYRCFCSRRALDKATKMRLAEIRFSTVPLIQSYK